jgi:hypothetical protein
MTDVVRALSASEEMDQQHSRLEGGILVRQMSGKLCNPSSKALGDAKREHSSHAG